MDHPPRHPPLIKPMTRSLRRPAAAASMLAAAMLLGGCASPMRAADSFLGLITPYRIDIVQGNVVTREQVALVRPGMSRSQVRDALGSPLLTDVFHADRWDYLFTIRRQGTAPQRRSIIARFEGDLLQSLDAPPDLPSEREFVASITRARTTARAPTLELSEAQRKALPAPVRREAPPAEPVGPVREYPPLEPT